MEQLSHSDENQLIHNAGTDAISSVFTQLVTANHLSPSQAEELCRKLCDELKQLCDQITATDCQIDKKILRLRIAISKIGVTVCIEMSKKQHDVQQKSVVDSLPTVDGQKLHEYDQNLQVIEQQLHDCDSEINDRVYIQQPRTHRVQQTTDSGSIKLTKYKSVAAVYKRSKKKVTFSVEIATISTFNVIDDDSTDGELSTMFQSTDIRRY